MSTTNNDEILATVRRAIEKAFDPKAEAYSPSELAKYFHTRKVLPTLIHQRKHHVLKGRKGTGKTAILRYLSLPVQIHCSNNTNGEFAGFYLPFGENRAPLLTFDADVEQKLPLLFGHWFNLYSCQVITKSIAVVKNQREYEIDESSEKIFLSQLWNSFFKIPSSMPSSTEEMSSTLGTFQKELRRLFSASSAATSTLAKEYPQETQYKYNGIITNVVDFPDIIERLQQSIQFFENRHIFLLIDEYDNLSAAQQMVVNTAMAGSSGQYYGKFGVLNQQGLKHRGTITGLTLHDDQLKFIDMEEFRSSREYEDFVRGTIEVRLAQIVKDLSAIPIVKDLFVDLDTLLPAKTPYDRLREQGIRVRSREGAEQLNLLSMDDRKSRDIAYVGEDVDIGAWWTLRRQGGIPAYCGIKTICLLSSGLIRSAIEIIYRILRQGFSDHFEILTEIGCIPYDIQDSIIREEAAYWMETKLLADIKGTTWDGKELLAEIALRLIRSLLRQFEHIFLNSSRVSGILCKRPVHDC